MNRITLFILITTFFIATLIQAQPANIKPPVAERIPYTIHGTFGDRVDDYYWMNDRENKKVIDHLKAENEYTQKMMEHTTSLQNRLFTELQGRIKEDESSVPYKKGDYYYYSRYVKGGEYPIICRKKNSLSAQEEIVIDGNDLVKGHNFLSFDYAISPDQTKACIIMDVHGRNFYTIKIKDLTTGNWLKDEIEDTRGGCEWTNDNKAIVYAVPDKVTLRTYQVKHHIIGQKQSEDKLLIQEDDETLDIYIYKSRSESYIFADAERSDASVVRYTDANNPGEFKIIAPLEENVFYDADHTEGNFFFIKTNYESKNYKLCTSAIGNTSKKEWKDVISHRTNVFLNSVQFFKTFMLAEESENGLTKLRIIRQGAKDEFISFDEAAYYTSSGYNPEFKSETFRYGYSSLITPYSTYEYNIATKEKTLLKQEEIPSGYKKALYATERIMVPARDGKLIPVAIVYRTDMYQKNGTAPGFIYGYGAYGSSNEDYFDSDVLSLLDRGFVYINTHIRGGQEMGGEWYDDGKMLNKKNTFYDFIDCSLWMIKNNYVANDKLFANGGSAGGLLMGAITNMNPELYRGIIADVPFVDAITTMEDETIPLTTFEWLEWGNPKIKEQYDYMMTYSPYDNVVAKNYPNLLVTTGLNDSQVQYFEPAKWVAKLRQLKTDNNLLLFKINMDAGHGGQSGRYESLKETAFMYAFMLDILGIKN